MKKLVVLFFVALFLFSCVSTFAQFPPQPPCCIWTPKGPIQGGMPFLQAKLDVSNQALQLQGITRDQLLNQISSTFFIDKKVDLVILSKQIISKPVFSDSGWIVMQVEETIYYKTSRASITTDYLNAVSEIGLTDGATWVKINFRDDTIDPNPKS
jgi:hypothetical protein